MMGRSVVALAAVLLLSPVVVVGGAGCRKQDAQSKSASKSTPEALRGTWRAEGTEAPMADGTQPPSWWVEYTFNPDGYRMEAHPPARREQGAVNVVSEQGRRVTVKLEGDRTAELELAEDGESFILEGFRYVRTGK